MTGPGLSRAVWRKSSRSHGNGGDCVEVSFVDNVIAVRDSKNAAGPVLAFGATRWAEFVGSAKHGGFGLA
jgi:hypothetical protein